MSESAVPEFLQDPYLDWTEREGVPVTEDFGVDLFDLAMKPWPRFGVPGGIVHLKGRGEGFSLLWYEGDEDFIRIDWRDGCMFAPPDQMFHQHFNTGAEPTRYMATAIGNSRYPFTARNRAGKIGVDVSVKEGGMQIELEDQDPRIHRMYLEGLAKNGVRCRMTKLPPQ